VTSRGWALFLFMSVLWGVPYLLIKVAVDDLGPAWVAFGRTVIALAVLLPLARRRRVLGCLRGRWRGLALIGLLEVAAPFLLISAGERHVSSSLTGLLIASEPLLVALLALRLDATERVDGTRLVGLVVGIAGVGALLGLDVGGDRWELLGAAMVLAATACYATGALLVKRRFADLPPLPLATGVIASGSVLLLPAALLDVPARAPSAGAVAAVATLGVACTAIGFLGFFALIGEAGAGRATVITYVNPAVAVALGVAVLGEPLGAATVAGFLLIVAGSWLSTGGSPPWARRRAPRDAPREAGANLVRRALPDHLREALRRS
jgi:drug/metabolite transporter (DMT)-like permease